METKLKTHREKLNLTQEELAEKAGISVRSIQRIEAGSKLKGYSLRALAKALGIEEKYLIDENNKQPELNYTLIKYINLSSILFLVLPPLNIIAPFIIMWIKREFNHLTRQIVSIQILLTFFSLLFFLVGIFVRNWLSLGNKVNLLLLIIPITLNLIIIVTNAAGIDKEEEIIIKIKLQLSLMTGNCQVIGRWHYR